ncbi:MAG: hypothetical protein LBE17_00325 [Treponema sp.]|nr:hypothetical protein [Treponema sp.]
MEKLRMGVLGCSKQYALRAGAPLRESLLIDPYAIASTDALRAQPFAVAWDFTKPFGSCEELRAGQYLLDFDAFADAFFASTLSGIGKSVIRC